MNTLGETPGGACAQKKPDDKRQQEDRHLQTTEKNVREKMSILPASWISASRRENKTLLFKPFSVYFVTTALAN